MGRHDELHKLVRAYSRPLNTAADLDPLLEQIGEARYVLLGEASHGTSEYYEWRRRISERLIQEKGFSFIAVEGDWPDCYQINRYVKGLPDAPGSGREVLANFQRWPTWIWANEEVLQLVEWMRQYNESLPQEDRIGFYGLDVYSLWQSLQSIVEYLQQADPAAVQTAKRALECFEPFEDVQEYARKARWLPDSCEDEVVALLREMLRKTPGPLQEDPDSFFDAQQNALITKNAERYYRAIARGGSESWNIRDRHMVETLDRLMKHHGPNTKAIIWEHNTHIGDARATDMPQVGMINVGQLVREQHGPDGVVLVGFGSHRGRVIAAPEWGAGLQNMSMPLAREGSWEDVLHQVGEDDRLLIFREPPFEEPLLERRGHRAIGVVYQPDREAYVNYIPTVLPQRYDAFLYLDETHALKPISVMARQERDAPEMYPTGM